MANNFDEAMTFTGQKRRVRPVRRVQVATHLEDLEAKPLDLATPPPPAIEPAIIQQVSEATAEDLNVKVPQAKEALYAAKAEEVPIDEFAFLSGLDTKAHGKASSPTHKTASKESLIDKTSVDSKPVEEKKSETIVAAGSEKKSESITEKKSAPSAEKKSEPIVAVAQPTEVKKSVVSPKPEEALIKTVTMEATPTVAAKDEKKTSPTVAAIEPGKKTTSAVETTASKTPTSSVDAKTATSSVDAKTATSSVDVKKSSVTETIIPAAAVVTAGVVAATTMSQEPMTEKSVPVLPGVYTSPTMKSSTAPLNPPRVPARTDRNSLMSVDSRGVVMDFNDAEDAIEEEREFKESLKPRMLPVQSVAKTATKDPEQFPASPPIQASNIRPSSVVSNKGVIPLAATGKEGKSSPIKLATYQSESEELQRLRQLLDQQKAQLEKEFMSKKQLQHQLETLKSKSNAQEEAITYKDNKMSKLEKEYIDVKNDLTALKLERDRINSKLEAAESDLKNVSETNATEYLAKSDEINDMKQKLDDFAAIIGQRDKDINALNQQLQESKSANITAIFDSLSALNEFDQDFINAVEAEIKKFEALLQDETEYSAKLEQEVESEYAFWKRSLSNTETK